VVLVVTGGFVTTASGLRISARSPLPAFAIAAVALLMWAAAARRVSALSTDLEALDAWLSARVAWLIAALALAATATAIAFNSFSATGADASGYLSQAVMLLRGELTVTEPLAAIAKWKDGEATMAPLGWRAVGNGLQVPTYAIGLPLLLAPLHALGGAPFASLIVPVTFGAAISAIAVLAYRVGGPAAAVVATVWFATSPVALVESMQVMSDVPVTAAWLVCWWFIFRRQSLAAGLVAAVAVLIRPNIAPVALLPALYVLFSSNRAGVERAASKPRDLVLFALPVAASGMVVGYLQWRYFGSPLNSGYGAATEIYALGNVIPNARLYGGWLVETHGPWLLAAPLGLMTTLGRVGGVGRVGRAGDLLWLFAFAAAIVAAYLAYSQFEVWTYLRFLLPALAVAMIGTATALAAALNRVPSPVRLPVLLAVLLAITAANLTSARRHDVFRFAERNVRARVVGERLGAVLPVNATIVSGEQSGAMRYYTGRTILRWDLMDEAAMRDAVEWVTLNGYQVWVVLDDWEEEAFRRRLPALAAITLDYEPTVESAAGVGIRTRAWRARRFMARSSNNEYATGTTTSVRKSDSVWPPMTTTAIVRRSSAPGPVPSASGNIPPTSASVVIRIGRSRSRLASRMAMSRSCPWRRRLSVWSICRIAFLATTPKSTSMPSAE
jgi:hypothetical protein